MPESKLKCPDCKSTKINTNGTRITRRGRVTRFQCQKCGRTFNAPKRKPTKGVK
jgi:transposase-like protein